MPSPYDFESVTALGQKGNTSAAETDPIINALNDISGGTFQLKPIVQNSAAYSRLAANTIQFAFLSAGQLSGLPGKSMIGQGGGYPFGMEAQESASWWYSGGGAALVRALTDAPYPVAPYVLFPILCRIGDAGGWFREPLTLKNMLDGKYSDGLTMSFRWFDVSERASDIAFPNIATPTPTPTVTPLADVFSGKYNGVKFNEPAGEGDALGLFPNWPSGAGSILDAGLKHYYLSSWHSPARLRFLAVNKTFFDTTLTPQQRSWIEIAARAACMRSLADSMNGADAYVKQFQTLGAVIHENWPTDVLERLRTATYQVHESDANADLTGTYRALLDHIRNYMKGSTYPTLNGGQVRWRATTDRKWRLQHTLTEAVLRPNR